MVPSSNKEGVLCIWLATQSLKKVHTTEPLTEETRTGERIEAIQDTGVMKENIPTANILNPKDVCRVGCWNLRTLYQTGKLAQVVNEMEQNNIEILGVCETRWT